MDMLSGVMAWEADEMDDEQEAKFFQMLVDNGAAWTLQGVYGRTAVRLMQAGRVKATTEQAKVYLKRGGRF